jgi:hypothetical protein
MQALPILATVTLLGSIAAQSPEPLPITIPTDPVRTLAPAAAMAADEIVVDRVQPGILWAAGPTWKASFAADGTTFVPCFGSSAPRNFPTHLARATVRVGEQMLHGDAIGPIQTADTISYHGRAFTERYVLGAAGIEQQFVLNSLPNRGAITVDVPFTTELTVAATGEGFRFTGEYGGFGYGRAVAIDGRGRRCELATERTGEGFRIVVPGVFVAEASLPLLIDPLVGAVTAFTNDTRPVASTDMAWHEGMGCYCLTWERVYSATDSDVYVRYLDGNMQFASASLAVDITTESWRQPRIASVGSAQNFLVVAQKSTANVAPFSAQARLVSGTTPFVQPVFALFGAGYEIYALDVGGDPSTLSARFCIVAEGSFNGPGSHDIAAEVRTDLGSLVTSSFLDTSATLELTPQVSKSCGMPGGGTQGWGIAYLRRTGPSTNQPLFTCVTRDLVPTATAAPTPFQVAAANGAIAISSPTDHAQGRNYMVFAQYDSGGWDFGRGGLFNRTGTFLVPTGTLGSGSRAVGEGQLDSDGTRFVLVVNKQQPNPSYNDVTIVLWGNTGTWLDSQEWISGNTQNDVAPCVGARRSGGGPDRTYGLAWAENLSPSGSRIICSNYDGIMDGPQFATRLTSCGNLGFLSGGTTVLGGSFNMQMVSNTGIVGWVVGLPVDLPIGICPGCRQGVAGSAVLGQSYNFVVPRHAAFVGMTLAFQGFQFLPTPGSGACLNQVNLSNTLDATIR